MATAVRSASVRIPDSNRTSREVRNLPTAAIPDSANEIAVKTDGLSGSSGYGRCRSRTASSGAKRDLLSQFCECRFDAREYWGLSKLR